MLSSMTGFGAKETKIASVGRVRVELRSTNHKFLEIVLHLPDGFLPLEDRIRKEIAEKIKRGRVVCVINLGGIKAAEVFVNRDLLKKYLAGLKIIQKEFGIRDNPRIDTVLTFGGIIFVGK